MADCFPYRGRLAPSPTGFLHRGHAATFLTAQRRAREHGGTLVLRVEDLDHARCQPTFAEALIEDLRWIGLDWQEGPIFLSARTDAYFAAWRELAAAGQVYPCTCTRRDVERAARAPHPGEHERVYPGTCRSRGADRSRAGATRRPELALSHHGGRARPLR